MNDQAPVAARRKVSILLGIGIFLLPIAFSWFLLRKGHSLLSRTLGFGWLALVTVVWIGGINAPPTPQTASLPPETNSSENASPSNSAAEKAAPETVPSRWQYSETTDEMRGTTAKHASVISDNELDFEFPYGRGNSTTLTLRKDRGTDVILAIEKGQFLCNGFTDDSYVSVKFDDGPIQRYNCTRASDGSSDVAFIRNSGRFITALKTAERVVVEAEFYQSGRRQIIFSTQGLLWD